MKIKLGKFRMGQLWVNVILNSGSTGGDFICTPPDKGTPEMTIGLDEDDFDRIAGTLLHEAFEMSLCVAELRYDHSGKWNRDSSDYLYVFNHPQFSRVCSDVGEFLSVVMPVARIAWEKLQKKRK